MVFCSRPPGTLWDVGLKLVSWWESETKKYISYLGWVYLGWNVGGSTVKQFTKLWQTNKVKIHSRGYQIDRIT